MTSYTHVSYLLPRGCGKPPSMIGISQARNLDDVAALLRDLYRRNARLLACKEDEGWQTRIGSEASAGVGKVSEGHSCITVRVDENRVLQSCLSQPRKTHV